MLKEELLDEPMEVSLADNPVSVEQAIRSSWSRISPFWPLKNLIAVNPVSGFEELNFYEALTQAKAYFQQQQMPPKMQEVNRQTIKWLQVYFDEGQATIGMPFKEAGLLQSILSLIRYDKQVCKNDKHKIKWLEQCPKEPEALITEALFFLEIEEQQQELFLTLMLTTLPGWASYVQYKAAWAHGKETSYKCLALQSEYLAFRLVLTWLIWPKGKELLDWHKKALDKADQQDTSNTIINAEKLYQQALLGKIAQTAPPQNKTKADAQLVFCIDVRSEPFRRALEAQGNYQTYGFAGFFGLPVSISNPVTGESYSSCPVLLKPAYNVTEVPVCDEQLCRDGYSRMQGLKKLYQSLKYTFTTPFSLVEAIGAASGLWMSARTIAPRASHFIQSGLKKVIDTNYAVTPDIDNIPVTQQVAISAAVLKMIGLTDNFAPLVVFCGHGSTTQNNAFATALDCGACGGRHGAPNARALAKILNSKKVREDLRDHGISIPDDTQFVAAEHNTTTDDVEIYATTLPAQFAEKLRKLTDALEAAKHANVLWRGSQLGNYTDTAQAQKAVALRAKDWAEVRPEWGLARNASFIIGPRWLTKDIDLEGRSFLHSYEWEKDPQGASLTAILTAPVVVGQWINAQYLFSALDNVAFGAGSKVTNNITGKIGIMQGNASDLMNGLPLQSVFKSDEEPYHTPLRLSVVVYSPKERIDGIIANHAVLQKLFGKEWIHMICHDPNHRQMYRLNGDLNWVEIN